MQQHTNIPYAKRCHINSQPIQYIYYSHTNTQKEVFMRVQQKKTTIENWE